MSDLEQFCAGHEGGDGGRVSKPIEEVEFGDRVLATNPEIGESVSRKVVATVTGEGQKRLVEATVDIDGQAGDVVETITATDGHPFWVADLEEWVPAGELQSGDWLRTGSGSWVQIQSIKIRTASQRVHNLTVDDLHAYHVLAETTPVLVHTCNNPATHDVANIFDHLDNNAYFHYTSERGHSGIMADDGSLRIGVNSAGKVHVARDVGSSRESERSIFTGGSRYVGKADYVFVSWMSEGVDLASGFQPNELIVRGSLKISAGSVIFHGRNPF